MEKRIRKNIKKEFQKIVRNISGEYQETSKPPEAESRVFGTRTVGVQPEIPQCTSSSPSTSQNTLSALESVGNNSLEAEVLKSSSGDNQQINDLSDKSIACDPLEDLSMNFHSILKKEYFSDVNIKCGADILKAHKIVLCARSPVFEAMFINPMQESENGVVIIEDIEAQVLRDLLDFVYSGQLKDLTVSKACDLLYAAEKYQIRTLKQLCVDHLRSNLSVENSFQILECANLYDASLRSHTLKYISDQFLVIQATEEWKTIQLKSPALALEVYSTVVKDLQRKN